jgi:hypothetical protein
MSIVQISANVIDQNCKHLQTDTSIRTLIKKQLNRHPRSIRTLIAREADN